MVSKKEKKTKKSSDMTREYVIGIRAGLEYAVMILDMEQKKNGTIANARKEIKSDIADITRTLEK